MVDFSVQPAAHEDAKADTRAAAKWLIASFAGVGAVLLSGIGLSSFGGLDGWRLVVAWVAFLTGTASVIAAVTSVGQILTPEPITLRDLAERQRKRNNGGPLDQDALVEYLERDPSFFQGMTLDAPEETTLIVARENYEAALFERFRTAEIYWRAEEANATEEETTKAKKAMNVANTRVQTMHLTVRRLEQIATAQQTVLGLRRRRDMLTLMAGLVALSIGTFAAISGSR